MCMGMNDFASGVHECVGVVIYNVGVRVCVHVHMCVCLKG